MWVRNKVQFEEYLLLGYDALHGVISQKKILFKTTAVKTSNPIKFSSFGESKCRLLLNPCAR
jgi:hypothetical protein